MGQIDRQSQENNENQPPAMAKIASTIARAAPKLDEVTARGRTEAQPTFVQVARGYWWIVLLALAICLGSATYFASIETPVYQTKTTLIIAPSKDLKAPRDISDTLNTLDRRSVVATLAMLPSSRNIRQGAQQQLQLSEAQLSPYSVKTSVVPDSNVLQVTVDGPDPTIAAAYADAVADQSVANAGFVYDLFEMQILDRARQPTEPIGVGLARRLIAGAVFGLMIGIAAACLLAYFKSGEWSAHFFGTARNSSVPNAVDARNRPSGVSGSLPLRKYGKPKGTNVLPGSEESE